MDDEKLIECVRKHSCLYDISHAKYMDTKYKAKIWKEIGQELKVSDSVCKGRWQNVRDHFKKYHGKRLMRGGQTADKIRRHKYEDILSFLLPHFKERCVLSYMDFHRESIDQTEDSHGSVQSRATMESRMKSAIGEANQLTAAARRIFKTEDELREATGGKEPSSIPLSTETPSVLGTIQIDDDQLDPSQSPRLDQNTQTSMPSTSDRRNETSIHPSLPIKYIIQQKETACSKLVDYILNKNRAEFQNSCNPHPVDAFLSGIAPSLKRFSPYYQHVARGRIFTIVQELELEQLKSENLSRSSTPVTSWSSQSPPPRQPTNE